jgi:5'' nucleotidase, deoxy (Pyrimidine), cytosolic type C protein (NT5C).
MRKQIYLDCDGVLADFDKGAEAVLGMPPQEFERRYNPGLFWNRLAQAPDFFARLEPMPDAFELYEAVKDRTPIILTGLPRGTWAEPQKRRWAARWFPGVPVITTLAALKREHCHPGDVLVDDRDKHRRLWEAAGGRFVHHRNARSSIAELRALGYL